MVSEKEHEKYLIEYLTIRNQPPEYDAWKYHLDDCNKMIDNISGVITTEQLHSTKSELRFCAGSNPALAAFRRFAMARISCNGPG